MQWSRDDFSVFVSRPICAGLMVVSVWLPTLILLPPAAGFDSCRTR
ncbi:hypothetical protein [Azospirillum endophyticum]